MGVLKERHEKFIIFARLFESTNTMAQSLSQLYVHIIFHIKGHTPIRPVDAERVHSYIAGVINNHDCIPIQINGMPDHIHILCVLSKNISLAKFVQEVKGISSHWIKNLAPHYNGFEWQKGYAGFSVSPSVHDKTVEYIRNQQSHHTKLSFKEEYLIFLKEYGIQYDERYLWSD